VLNKIDPYLLKLVNVCSNEGSELDCIVYSNNVNFLKKYLINNNICKVVAVYNFISAIGVKVCNGDIFKISKFFHKKVIINSYFQHFCNL
jgi:hypothetical protein